jgi:hypothetical protein
MPIYMPFQFREECRVLSITCRVPLGLDLPIVLRDAGGPASPESFEGVAEGYAEARNQESTFSAF